MRNVPVLFDVTRRNWFLFLMNLLLGSRERISDLLWVLLDFILGDKTQTSHYIWNHFVVLYKGSSTLSFWHSLFFLFLRFFFFFSHLISVTNRSILYRMKALFQVQASAELLICRIRPWYLTDEGTADIPDTHTAVTSVDFMWANKCDT